MNTFTLNLYKAFGIYKEDYLPFNMNKDQYETMRKHFALVWPHDAETEGEKNAWYQFQNEQGPWYARGLYGRVHRLEVVDGRDSLLYTAPNQWHYKGEFDTGTPGQTHPLMITYDQLHPFDREMKLWSPSSVGGRGHGIVPGRERFGHRGIGEGGNLPDHPQNVFEQDNFKAQNFHVTYTPDFKMHPDYVGKGTNPQNVTADTLTGGLYGGQWNTEEGGAILPDMLVDNNVEALIQHHVDEKDKNG